MTYSYWKKLQNDIMGSVSYIIVTTFANIVIVLIVIATQLNRIIILLLIIISILIS